MKFFTLLFFFLAFLIHAENENSGWVSLFDGKTTKGWKAPVKIEKFEAVSQELHLFSKKNVWILNDLKVRNFEVKCEVKIPLDYEGFNSGLGFRLIEGNGKPKGYQCEIDRARPGGIYGIGLGGWIYPKKDNSSEFSKKASNLFKISSWNHFRVYCSETKALTFMNNQLISETNELHANEGKFGIQHHGKGGTVRFRNIWAKKL
ncbi:MAG: DUF1080 domain-containing protein [Verrucomicrobiota bacterium]|nr:DUF1080 domain-containing protein [Verrucomicrobiota bacterium]